MKNGKTGTEILNEFMKPTPPQSQSPETDEKFGRMNYSPEVIHARTLEKQRDEALAEVKTWKEQDALGNEEIAERGKTILELQQERTSLLAQIATLQGDLVLERLASKLFVAQIAVLEKK